MKGDERPDPEVPAKARRRRFSAQYKKRILEEADACKAKPGAMGALLRREGLYSSHLTTWRKQREKGELEALAPKKRGRKAKPVNPLARRVRELERETRRLKRQLDRAETIISFQKKLSEMLGISLDQKENDETC
ncbi:MAG: transposase [Deltaproteobacteria bacterium]|nr:transposase [Deltaproteobacteria bacterium]